MLSFTDRLLPFFNERPSGSRIDTIVIHSMFDSRGKDPFSVDGCFGALTESKVAPHYSIDRTGAVIRSVAEEARAWHAGQSKMPFNDDKREGVNDFSVGIELIATQQSGFAQPQYESCAALCVEICSRHPIINIVGHEHISPGRKVDPGRLFDWWKFRSYLARAEIDVGRIRFP